MKDFSRKRTPPSTSKWAVCAERVRALISLSAAYAARWLWFSTFLWCSGSNNVSTTSSYLHIEYNYKNQKKSLFDWVVIKLLLHILNAATQYFIMDVIISHIVCLTVRFHAVLTCNILRPITFLKPVIPEKIFSTWHRICCTTSTSVEFWTIWRIFEETITSAFESSIWTSTTKNSRYGAN